MRVNSIKSRGARAPRPPWPAPSRATSGALAMRVCSKPSDAPGPTGEGAGRLRPGRARSPGPEPRFVPARFARSLLAVFALCFATAATAGIADGLALYLPLTGDLRDHSANRHPIVNVGNVELKPEGAWFAGRKDWLEAPFIALNERPYAVAMWIKETTLNRQVGLVEQFDLNQRGRHLHLMLRGNRQPYFGHYARNLASPVSVPREQEWLHVVFQYDGEAQQIWIDGRLVVSMRAEPYHGTFGVTAIGKAPRWSNVESQDFVGFMREVRFYHRTLAVEEIAELSDARWLPGSAGQLAASDGKAGSAKERSPLAAMLPENRKLPFLEIDGKRITVNGRPGQVYELQGTGDFNTWTPLGRSTNETGRVTYVESDDAPSMQFYRVMVVNAAE